MHSLIDLCAINATMCFFACVQGVPANHLACPCDFEEGCPSEEAHAGVCTACGPTEDAAPHSVGSSPDARTELVMKRVRQFSDVLELKAVLVVRVLLQAGAPVQHTSFRKKRMFSRKKRGVL